MTDASQPPAADCPECGAPVPAGAECADFFYQMLYWENERAENGEVHHLAVLCYYLQHPSRYSPDGLVYAQELLRDFVDRRLSPQAVRRSRRDSVNSGSRGWKVTARKGAGAAYPHPPRWTVTAADVVAAGIDRYRESVRQWAQSMREALKALEGT